MEIVVENGVEYKASLPEETGCEARRHGRCMATTNKTCTKCSFFVPTRYAAVKALEAELIKADAAVKALEAEMIKKTAEAVQRVRLEYEITEATHYGEN